MVSGCSSRSKSARSSRKALFEFAFQDDGIGEETVFQGVAAGVALALGRDGPAGFGSVGTGGFDLTFSSHFDFVIACEMRDLAEFRGDLLITGEI